jgi:phytoene dehydrogenase-like protein
MADTFDAVVVGAGPNGLAAAIELASAGLSVVVYEAEHEIGGGARTAEVTLPGFRHDICSAVHPMAIVSPFFAGLDLEAEGLSWIHPPTPLAHPFDDGTAAVIEKDLEATARMFDADDDGFMWRAMFEARVARGAGFFADILRPIRLPRHPIEMARFGLGAVQSANGMARRWFRGEHARGVFAGCSAHSMLPLERAGSAAFGLILSLSAHVAGWPVARGGSSAIVEAMAAKLTRLGGVVRTDERIVSMAQLPEARAIVFDVMPRQLAAIAGEALPAGYRERLMTYRHGPGVFKIDWALDGPIPWTAEACRRAGTVHLGPRLEDVAISERAAWQGEHAEHPFVLVAQQSLFDETRAPAGKQTGWAYCHVPNGSTVDMTERIEAQVERFAPGFRDRILARTTMDASAMERHDAGFIGGDIGGGANDLLQFLARPLAKWDPYATPNPRLFLGSSATPPGGGVHGMCGYWAARSALARAFGRALEPRPTVTRSLLPT